MGWSYSFLNSKWAVESKLELGPDQIRGLRIWGRSYGGVQDQQPWHMRQDDAFHKRTRWICWVFRPSRIVHRCQSWPFGKQYGFRNLVIKQSYRWKEENGENNILSKSKAQDKSSRVGLGPFALGSVKTFDGGKSFNMRERGFGTVLSPST